MNKLPQYFCVKNDGSDLFKKTVIRYLNDNDHIIDVDAIKAYYGRDISGICWHYQIVDFSVGADIISLLTLEEFIEMSKEFVSEFVLPKNWHVVVTEENQKALSLWYSPKYIIEVGYIVGCCYGDGSKSYNPIGSIKDKNYDFGIEITFDQFKKYVLKDSQKIIGYKLLKPEYEQAASSIVGYVVPSSKTFSEYMLTSVNGAFEESLKDAGVLDIWFEPVYVKEKYKVGDWVYITGKTITEICVCGNGLPYDGSHDGVFQLMDIDESKHTNGYFANKSHFMFKDREYYFCISKDNILRRATEDEIIDAEHNSLLKQAELRFPIGTKFYPNHIKINKNFNIITNNMFRIIGYDDNKRNVKSIIALTDEGLEWSREKNMVQVLSIALCIRMANGHEPSLWS